MISPIKKGVTFFKNFKAHWNEPYKGRYIASKEIVAYGVGGIGVHFATTLANAIGLSASNLLVGSCIGLQPFHLQIMLIVANIIGFGITAAREYTFDNVKSPLGKFRPFLKWMGIPTVISAILFVWMPYENMSYVGKAVAVEIIFLLINCFNPFYSEAFSTLLQVMSPDSEERTDVMSVAQIIFSLAPTLTNLFIPFLAQLTGGLTDIRTYRIIYPIITIVGLFIAFPVYKGTKERIIKPKSQENEIRFFDAIRSIVKNKYFWITNSATWIGFLETSYMVILGWSFVYGHPEQEQYLGVANTVIGNGALWAMMAAPFLIRLVGKRNLLIWCNIINIFLLAFLYPCFNNIWLVILIFYINNFVTVLSNIYNPGMIADMKDYQQLITGERIDGMFGVVGLIGTFIGFFTGLVVPGIYEKFGLHGDYSVLYDASMRTPLFKVLIICSVIGAALNVIPYFFYDLTEEKHQGIVNVLRVRAMFDDYANDDLSDESLRNAMGLIMTAENLKNENQVKLSKDNIKSAKKLPHKTEEEKALRHDTIKSAKADYHKMKKHNENIRLAPVVLEELNKFNTVRYKYQISVAEIVSAGNYSDFTELRKILSELSIPDTADKKLAAQIKNDTSKFVREINEAIRLRQKYYKDGLCEPDKALLETAQSMPTDNIKHVISKKFAVKKALKERSVYSRCLKPIAHADTIIKEEKIYKCMDELKARYNSLTPVTAD